MLRTVGLLFGLSLMLTACDPADFFAFFGGASDDTPPAAQEPADEAPADEAPGPDPVSDESDAVSDESEAVSDESEAVIDDDDEEPGAGSGGEHQCFRNRGEAEAGGDDAEADAAADEA